MIFGEKKDAGATVTYSTLSTTDLEGKSGKPGVLLTFNLCSIRADEIVLHKIDWSLEARGNLTIEENGIRRIEKGMIKIKIVGDRLLLEK